MINIIIAIIGTLYGAYTDLKTGEIPDWVSHTMIILGFIWTLFAYQMSQWFSIWLIAVIVFVIGYLMYVFGQIGGGDVKLFTALTLLIPFYQHEIYPFVLPVFIASGLLFMVVMPVQYFLKIIKMKKKIKDFNKKITRTMIYEIILFAFLIFWIINFGIVGLIIIPLMVAASIMAFKEDIIKLFFAQKKEIQKLDEEDVIALELIDEKIKKKLKLWRKTLTIHELNNVKRLAKKYRLKTIIVCEDLPKYIPYIFVSLILNLIFGDLLMTFYFNLF